MFTAIVTNYSDQLENAVRKRRNEKVKKSLSSTGEFLSSLFLRISLQTKRKNDYYFSQFSRRNDKRHYLEDFTLMIRYDLSRYSRETKNTR